jgi:anti-anti-sigma regulatory factor
MKKDKSYIVVQILDNIVSINQCITVSRNIKALILKGNAHIALDFSQVSNITGSFAGFLVEIIKKIRQRDGDILFFGVNSVVADVLDKVELAEYIVEDFEIN